MPYQVGDQVVLATHGVGQIVRLEEKQFAAPGAAWYYEITTAKSTVWVAVENPQAAGLRPIAAAADLRKCGRILSGEPTALDPDHHRRRADLSRLLRTGTLNAICEVIRDLSALSGRRPLPEADANLLRRARDFLCEEWSAVEGVSVGEASQAVDGLLRANRNGTDRVNAPVS